MGLDTIYYFTLEQPTANSVTQSGMLVSLISKGYFQTCVCTSYLSLVDFLKNLKRLLPSEPTSSFTLLPTSKESRYRQQASQEVNNLVVQKILFLFMSLADSILLKTDTYAVWKRPALLVSYHQKTKVGIFFLLMNFLSKAEACYSPVLLV